MSKKSLFEESDYYRSWAWYEETQRMPDRIKGAEGGKAWMREFVEFAKLRHDVEHPRHIGIYEKNFHYRHTYILGLFDKYFIEAECDLETKQNSLVVTFAYTSDGDYVMWHNLRNGHANEILYKYFKISMRAIRRRWRAEKRKRTAS